MLIAFVCGISFPMSFAATRGVFGGKVIGKNDGQGIGNVVLSVKELNIWQITNEQGDFLFEHVKPGQYTLLVSCLGYAPLEKTINITGNSTDQVIQLEVTSLSLEEVIVTAKEQELGSVSVIEQSAMDHLQPKSMYDIMQLLPGHLSEEPDLARPKQLKIREVGSIFNDQVITQNPTSALGAAVIIDGAPLSNNSNMQVLSTARAGSSLQDPTGATTSFGSSFEVPNVAGRGIDMRALSTNNIESIEVIRGIPSVEYGDLTSGAIIVKTKAGKTPYEVRLAIDPETKLLSVGKGFAVKNQGVMNINFDYTSAYPDVRQKYEGYQRVTANLGYSNTFFQKRKPLLFNMRLALHTTVDDEKSDPQLRRNEVITANNDGLRAAINGKWLLNTKWITNLSYNFSASYAHQHDYLRKLKTVTAGTMPLATSFTEGEHEAQFLPAEYYSELTVDGKPFNLFAQVMGNLSFSRPQITNNIVYGVEWRANGNNGDGRIFDLNYPPVINAISTIRQRSYKDIPTLHTMAVFAEDRFIIPLGNTQLSGQAGLRLTGIRAKGISSTNATTAWEPRINLLYQLYDNPRNKFLKHFAIRFGYGIAAKMPTLIHLYPDKAYFDETSLNYKDEENLDGSLAVLTTKIVDDTSNPDLKPAINRKYEAGLDFSFGNITANITGYYERQTGGFGISNELVLFEHRAYTVTGTGRQPYLVEGEGVYYYQNGQPVQATYNMDTSFQFYRMPINENVLIKQGIEYIIDLGKVKAIKTSFVVDGAWMYTKSYSTTNQYSRVNSGYQGRPFPYVMVMPDETTIRQRLTTSVRSITHIPVIRMVLSLTGQIIWMEKRQYLYEDEEGNTLVYATKDKEKIELDDVHNYRGDGVAKNVAPIGYIDRAGNYHDWNPELYLTQPYYSMVQTFPDHYFVTESLPPTVQFNMRLSKDFTDNLQVAFTANNFLNMRPFHKSRRSSGYIRRNFSLYFGAELRMKI